MDFIQIMEWWSNLPQDQKEKCYSYMNGKKVEPERPFDKLKILWDNGNRMYIFEHWVYCHHMNFRFETYDELETPKQVHQWLAEHCGFNTTAEVRMAIQQLKNQ